MSNNIIKKALSYSMGADLHEAWRDTRKRIVYEPRMKKSKDEAWNQEHGTDDVDIANLTFSELPSNWQYENLEAAKVAIAQVFERVLAGEEITDEMIEGMSSEVHEAWLTRNDWVYDEKYGDPNLAKPYLELSEEEKAKDRVQIMQAIEKIQAYQRGEIDVEGLKMLYGEMNIQDILSYSMGADLHEAWRDTRKRIVYEPRMKKSKDEAWNQEHGTDDVDIANLTFSELPSNWQYENLEAAKVAIVQVFERVMAGEEITDEMIEGMSSEVHEAWLTRNDWVYDEKYGDPNLTKPYLELSEEEKAKDRVQVMQAIEKVQAYQRGEIDIDVIIEEYGLTVEPEEIGLTEATKGVKQGEMNDAIDEMTTDEQSKGDNTQAIGEE